MDWLYPNKKSSLLLQTIDMAYLVFNLGWDQEIFERLPHLSPTKGVCMNSRVIANDLFINEVFVFQVTLLQKAQLKILISGRRFFQIFI